MLGAAVASRRATAISVGSRAGCRTIKSVPEEGMEAPTHSRKEISKSQKVFFWDTGIRNALLNTFAADELRPDIGTVWENWVIAEMAKRNALLGSPGELFFWRSRAHAEH